jgi:hypothetical protein
MADLIDEPCSSCHRKSVEVEFKYLHPWRLGIVWAILLLVIVGLAKGIVPLIPASHEWRLIVACVGAGVIANILGAFLEPRIAKRTAYFRCRLCGEAGSQPAICDVQTTEKF